LIAGRIGWHGLTTNDYETVGEFLVTGTELEHGAVSWDSCHRVSTEVWERDTRIQLAEGDLLLTKDGTIGKVALVTRLPGRATLNSGVFRVAPRNHVLNPRFAFWVLSSRLFVDFIDLLSSGSTINHLYQEDFVNFGLPLPSLATQRAIADYLDRETVRIDALIAAKQRMVELLELRWQEVLDAVIWSDGCPRTRLMHLVDLGRQVMYGIVLPGPDVGAGGIAIVKGGDVAQRRLSWEALCKTTPEIEQPYARARVRAGDLVFAIRGGIGDVAIVPEELTGANLTQDVARVAPRAGISSEWLMYALQSPTVQHDVRKRVTGATITGLNIWELERVAVPLASTERQSRDLQRLAGETTHHQGMRRALEHQITLLQERRQALITAAVTGQLDFPEAI